MRRSTRLLVAIVAGLVCVAGCGREQYRFPAETAPQGSVSSSSDPSDLTAERQAAGIADCPVTPAVAPVDDGLPELTLSCLGGGAGSTLSGLRGTPMVINFWAQWCGPCRDEAPHLAAVAKATQGRVQFIGVDRQDPRPGLAIEFAREAGWSYPQLFDQDGLTKEPPLQVAALPYTLLVSADGRIVHRHPGVISSEQQLRDLIAQYLGVTG